MPNDISFPESSALPPRTKRNILVVVGSERSPNGYEKAFGNATNTNLVIVGDEVNGFTLEQVEAAVKSFGNESYEATFVTHGGRLEENGVPKYFIQNKPNEALEINQLLQKLTGNITHLYANACYSGLTLNSEYIAMLPVGTIIYPTTNRATLEK